MSIKQKTSIHMSLRTVLILPYATLILLAIMTVGFISYWNGQAAVNDVAGQLRSEAMLGLKEHLQTFLLVPHQINQVNASAIQNGQMQLSDPEGMQRHFLNQVMIRETVTSIYFGNIEGGIIGGGREVDNSFYVTRTVDFKSGEFQKFSLNETDAFVFPPISSIPNFDARTRPWYVGAINMGGETWSDIYVLITGQDLAIAASRPVYDKNENLLGVVSVDIFLSQVSRYLETLTLSQIGQVFIMEQNGELVATSTNEPLFQDDGTGRKEQRSVQDSQSDVIREAGSLLLEQYGGYQNIPSDEQQIEFAVNGEQQFMQYLTVSDPYGLHWIVAVIIPEAAFMGQIHEGNAQTMQLILIALAIAIGISVFISTKISNRIGELDQSALALAQGDWKHALDETTRIKELKGLAVSFNQMKDQLRSSMDSLTTEVEERKRAELSLEEEIVRRRALFEESPDGILIIDPATARFLDFNTAAHHQLGYTREEFANLSIANVEANESEEETRKHFASLIAQGSLDFETQHRTRSGEIRDVHVKARVINTVKESIYYYIWRDVTEQKKLALELQKNHDFLSRIFEMMGQGLTITDAEGRFEFINPAYARIFGYEIEDLIGKFPDEITVEEDREFLARQRELRKAGIASTYESRLICADGRIANVLISGVPRDPGGTNGAITVITDLSEQKHIEEALRETKDALELALLREQQLARTDELTGINNRRSMFELAESKFEVAKRYKQPLAMIIFDVDYFKKVNDAHGHLAGDQALVEVTKSVQAQLRNADVFGRYGGEEFVILLPMTNAQQAYILAERIRKNIENFRMKSAQGNTISVTVSLGIAQIDTMYVDETVEKLFNRADEAMYQAKNAGRNCSRIFDRQHVSS
jgi:diguanylate cyclase (GGDEF)-like protein/PAS domain S-box-containing protein